MGPSLTLVAALSGWLAAGQHACLATLIGVEGSGPLPVGAMMAIGPDGQFVGSVGGGCVDSAVLQEAERPGDRARLLSYSAADSPWSVGPACGGRLQVLFEPLAPERRHEWQLIMRDLRHDQAVVRLCAVPHPDDTASTTTSVVVRRPDEPPADWQWSGDLGIPLPATAIASTIAGMRVAARRNGAPQAAMIAAGTGHVVATLWPRPPRLVLVGADAVATHLVALAAPLGYAVTVCDPRPAFTTPARFPQARHVVTAWPQRYLKEEATAGRIGPDTAVCVLTHDERVDIPTLTTALTGPPLSYLGALGSRATQQRRHQGLRDAGVPPDALRHVHGPAGLDLQGSGPETVALSILAEITAVRHGGSGRPLRELEGRLHRSGSV